MTLGSFASEKASTEQLFKDKNGDVTWDKKNLP